MVHNGFSESIVMQIRDVLQKLREKYNIENTIIKEDIFALLDQFCTVLYYPLEDKDINGIHVQRIVWDQKEDFVYINTKNPLEKQIYTAAHELGHIWEIDRIVRAEINVEDYNADDIINRFAAELLLPPESFKRLWENKIHELGYTGKNINVTRDNLLRVIVFLMNEFMVPYKAVVLRMEELQLISESVIEYLDDFEEKNSAVIESFIAEGQYEKLNRPTNRKSMKNLVEMINRAEIKLAFSERKISNIRKQFDINQKDTANIRGEGNQETFDILI